MISKAYRIYSNYIERMYTLKRTKLHLKFNYRIGELQNRFNRNGTMKSPVAVSELFRSAEFLYDLKSQALVEIIDDLNYFALVCFYFNKSKLKGLLFSMLSKEQDSILGLTRQTSIYKENSLDLSSEKIVFDSTHFEEYFESIHMKHRYAFLTLFWGMVLSFLGALTTIVDGLCGMILFFL